MSSPDWRVRDVTRLPLPCPSDGVSKWEGLKTGRGAGRREGEAPPYKRVDVESSWGSFETEKRQLETRNRFVLVWLGIVLLRFGGARGFSSLSVPSLG